MVRKMYIFETRTKILGMSLAFRSVIQKQNRLFLVFFAQLFSSVLRLGSADPNTTWWRRVSAGPNTWQVVKFSEMQFEAQAVSTMVKNHFAWLFSPPTYGIYFFAWTHHTSQWRTGTWIKWWGPQTQSTNHMFCEKGSVLDNTYDLFWNSLCLPIISDSTWMSFWKKTALVINNM